MGEEGRPVSSGRRVRGMAEEAVVVARIAVAAGRTQMRPLAEARSKLVSDSASSRPLSLPLKVPRNMYRPQDNGTAPEKPAQPAGAASAEPAKPAGGGSDLAGPGWCCVPHSSALDLAIHLLHRRRLGIWHFV